MSKSTATLRSPTASLVERPHRASRLSFISALPISPLLTVDGKYSIERLLSLEEYSRTRSYWHVIWVIVWTPLAPSLLLVVYQLPQLAPPSAGLQANWVYVLVRGGIGTAMIGECCLVLVRALIPELKPRLPLWTRLLYDLTAGLLYMALIVGFTHLWGFPVPFTSSIINPIVGAANIVVLYIIVRPLISQNSDLQKRFLVTSNYAGIISFVSIGYPAFMALFFAVGQYYPAYQPLVALITPLIKMALRKVMAHATREWEDLIPVMVTFSVELFNSLYQAICVQTGNSVVTMVAILAIDVVFAVIDQVWIYQRTKSLIGLLDDTKTRTLLPVVSDLCDDPRSLLAASVEELQALRSISLFSFLCDTALSPEVCKRLEKIDAAGVFVSPQRVNKASKLANSRARRQSTIKARLGSSKVSPTGPALPSSSAIEVRTCTASILSRKKQSTAVIEATTMLFHTEFSILAEYLECMIPFFYMINYVCLWLSPNGAYYPHSAPIKTVEEMLPMLLNILALLGLEVLTFVVFALILSKRLRIPPLHQLSYALESEATLVRANMLIILIMSLQFNLAHAGADFSFKFEWLNHEPQP